MSVDDKLLQTLEESREEIFARFNYMNHIAKRKVVEDGIFCVHRFYHEEGYWMSTSLVRFIKETD